MPGLRTEGLGLCSPDPGCVVGALPPRRSPACHLAQALLECPERAGGGEIPSVCVPPTLSPETKSFWVLWYLSCTLTRGRRATWKRCVPWRLLSGAPLRGRWGGGRQQAAPAQGAAARVPHPAQNRATSHGSSICGPCSAGTGWAAWLTCWARRARHGVGDTWVNPRHFRVFVGSSALVEEAEIHAQFFHSKHLP